MGADTAGVPVVIDLGLDRGEPTTYDRPGGRLTPSWFAPALTAVLLLFSVTASGPPPAPTLEALVRVVIGPGDPYVVSDTGQLVVQTVGELTAYDLATGARQWRVGQDVPTYRLRTGDGLLLLRPWGAGNTEPGTTAVSLRTGAQQWHNERSVVSFDGTGLMFAVDGVRSQSFGTGRRVERTVEALDPVGGQARWRLAVPSTAVLLHVPGPAGAPPRMLLVRDDSTAHLYDGRSGALLAVRQVPAANYEPDNPVVAGGRVLLRHPGPSGIEVTSYDPETMRPVWTGPAVGALEIMACGELACLSGMDGVRAIDPATGDLRWHRPGWRSIEVAGSRVIAFADGPDAPTGLVDPATGRVLADLTGWRPAGGIDADGELLVTKEVTPGPRTMVAVVGPGLARPRLLAELPAGTRECQAVAERLICRSVYGELIVWSYRTKAG